MLRAALEVTSEDEEADRPQPEAQLEVAEHADGRPGVGRLAG